MPNINEMINMMPQIQRPMKQPAPMPGQGDMSNFLSLQMMVNRELQSTQRLHQDLSKLIYELEKLIDRNDTPGFTESVAKMIKSLGNKLENPVINMDFPTDELVKIQEAVKSLKFESKEVVKVSNISEVSRVINDLKPLLVNLETSIENLSKDCQDVELDKESKGYLKKLEYLETDAKNPIAVRLSDGKEFYKAIGGVENGIRAMAGSSGNNFLTQSGSPTKASLDSNGNLRVANGALSSSSVTSVSGSASSTTLLAANTNRKGFIIFNDSTAILYVKIGATASITSFTYRLTPYGSVNEPSFAYTGVIDGIWASATGNARITELS